MRSGGERGSGVAIQPSRSRSRLSINPANYPSNIKYPSIHSSNVKYVFTRYQVAALQDFGPGLPGDVDLVVLEQARPPAPFDHWSNEIFLVKSKPIRPRIKSPSFYQWSKCLCLTTSQITFLLATGRMSHFEGVKSMHVSPRDKSPHFFK